MGIKTTKLIDLIELGLNRKKIRKEMLTFESEKYICVREGDVSDESMK